jgi:histidinol phosphatase-like enzyme
VFKHDEILQSHLDYSVPNSRIKYISPDIQKDIIGISGEMVRETIGRTSNDSEDFVLIGDEATDVSTHEQVSVCERFVEYTGGKLKSLFVRNFLVL